MLEAIMGASLTSEQLRRQAFDAGAAAGASALYATANIVMAVTNEFGANVLPPKLHTALAVAGLALAGMFGRASTNALNQLEGKRPVSANNLPPLATH